MKKLSKVLAIGGVFVMMLVFAGATLAFTSNTGPSVPETVEGVVSQVANFGDGEGRRGGPRGMNGGFIDREMMQEAIAGALGITVEELQSALEEGTSIEELATELGVDMETVRAAVTAAKVEAINAAVEAGDLTQEEADEILARMELKQLTSEIFSREDAAGIVAAELGVTVEELSAAKEAGTLDELIGDTDMEAVREAVQAAFEQAVNDAVEDGTITQEQADEILENGFGKRGHRGGPGRGGPRGGNGNGAPPAPAGDNA